MGAALFRWEMLRREVNGIRTIEQPGVRDPENPCESYDGKGYDGRGECQSDGHYLCKDCSHLSPRAPRFTETDEGRGERLRLFWRRNGTAQSPAGEGER